MTSLTAKRYTITDHPYDVIVARDPNGVVLASALLGKDGWQVTSSAGGHYHYHYVESKQDVVTLLTAIAELVTS